MKKIEVKRLHDKPLRYCCDDRKIKLKVGTVFEIVGSDELAGVYTITDQKKVRCDKCPLAIYDPKYSFSSCGLLKNTKLGIKHMFCQKDLRSPAYTDNAFTIKKLDDIMEGL